MDSRQDGVQKKLVLEWYWEDLNRNEDRNSMCCLKRSLGLSDGKRTEVSDFYLGKI